MWVHRLQLFIRGETQSLGVILILVISWLKGHDVFTKSVRLQHLWKVDPGRKPIKQSDQEKTSYYNTNIHRKERYFSICRCIFNSVAETMLFIMRNVLNRKCISTAKFSQLTRRVHLTTRDFDLDISCMSMYLCS